MNQNSQLPLSQPPSYNQATAVYPADFTANLPYPPQPLPPYTAASAASTNPPYPTAYGDPSYPAVYAGPAQPSAYAGPAQPSAYAGPAAYGGHSQPAAYAGPAYPAAAYGGPGYPTPYDVVGMGYKNDAVGVSSYGQGGMVRDDDVRLIGGSSVNPVNSCAHQNQANVNIMHDSDESGWVGQSFNNKNIRRAFIRKVFIILMAQLAVTVAFICFFIFCEPVKNWIQGPSGMYIYLSAYLTFLIMYIVLVCCPGVRRTWPSNIICLAVFTLALSYMAGTISSFHDTKIVLFALAITAAVCLSLAVFAIQTKIDFTMCSGLLFALCVVVFCFGFFCIIGGAIVGYKQAYILNCVYAALAALLFSLFLVYDIQMIMGGHKFELSPEEHIFGALQIYLDIVYLFLIILSLFGSRN